MSVDSTTTKSNKLQIFQIIITKKFEMETENSFATKSVLDITKKLYLSEETADVYFIFNIDGKKQRVPAHKNILATGSSVFRSMFYGKFKEVGDVGIVDSSPECFKEFLAIFYLQAIKVTNENVLEFINLANKYDMSEGIDVCEQFLINNVLVGQLCSHFAWAIEFNLNKLIAYCQSQIRWNADKVFQSDTFINCPKDVLEVILQMNDHSCNGIDVFNACKIWAENACKRNGRDWFDPQNIRRELCECFYLIPFVTMKAETFSNIVFANRALFTLDEIVDIMAFINTGASTEHTSKFIKSNSTNILFHWNIDRLVVCERSFTCKGNISIYQYESAVFSSNKKLLFGGFKFFQMISLNEANSTLSATITITTESSSTVELQEKIRIMTRENKLWPSFVELSKPIVLTPYIKCNILVDFSSNDLISNKMVDGWKCITSEFRTTTVHHDDITFEFKPFLQTSVSSGGFSIISQLYFNRL